ncbi:hypothetical protein V8E54_004928 [Elaphomyces granulatus]|jgi:hypothetical protein
MLRYTLAAFVLVMKPAITAAKRWRAARGATRNFTPNESLRVASLIPEPSLRVTIVKPFDEFSILPIARYAVLDFNYFCTEAAFQISSKQPMFCSRCASL